MANKAARLSDPTIHELSLVFAKKDGVEWGPRNPESRATVKAGAIVEKDSKKAFLVELVEKIKGWYTDGPVVGNVPDNIDHDGDGVNDYNSIAALFTSMYYDLQNAIYISDDGARSAAVVSLIDTFLRQLDELRAGDDTGDPTTGKAGARHSAADKASLAAITEAHAKLGKALEAANKAHGAIGDGVKSLGGNADDETNTSTQDDAGKAAALAAKSAKNRVAAAIAAKSAPVIPVVVKAGEVGEDGLPVNFAELVFTNGASNGGQ